VASGLEEFATQTHVSISFPTWFKFLTKIRNEGSDYILGMDANDPYDHDDIQDFFQDHDMVDVYSAFMEEHPAMHFRGSEQIDLISVSRRLSPLNNWH
jgi:hypothetical protein